MFKNHTNLLLSLPLIFSPLVALASDCSEKVGCDKKACEIQYKMDIAKTNGHTEKLNGLSDALEQVNTYCSNDDLKDELSDKIEDSQEEILEYRSDLSEAVAYQEEDKIVKYETKIEEEQRKIEQFEKELSLLP
ncbi:DUF1090 domain-containing protein [Vibrio sp. 10N.261.51.F12]|uniref:DUF1090 domain-containing protein n=1 Tax=Vibrio sp. 10N.261.51.F12 TaxID=3229679 RepID=UPI00354B7058